MDTNASDNADAGGRTIAFPEHYSVELMTINGIFSIYHIQSNYHTVCLSFSKLLEKKCNKISF